ncbi:MAG: triple tyrosine motif-containing protein [Bacteroidota bacterium]
MWAQTSNLGLPLVQSFPREVYGAAAVIGDIIQDVQGRMYFANPDGMLSYDGSSWEVYPLPNRTILRSLALAQDGTIYAGGQNEVGRFVPDQQGEWVFESLKDRIPAEDQSFEDVWDMAMVGDSLYFRASEKIFCLSGDKQARILADVPYYHLGKVGEDVWIQDLGNGTFSSPSSPLKPSFSKTSLAGKMATSLAEWQGGMLIGTERDGLYYWKNDTVQAFSAAIQDFLKESGITALARIDSHTFAVGTNFNGIVILHESGKILYHFNLRNGLIRNKVMCLFVDPNRNLWVGLENGINYLHLNSPFTFLYPGFESGGTGFTSRVFEDRLFLGTGDGLYALPWQEYYDPLEVGPQFELISGSKGQTWGLDEVENTLILGHNRGSFLIGAGANQAENFWGTRGAWTFDQVEGRDNLFVAGTYTGLYFFNKQGSQFVLLGHLDGFNESSRFVEQDDKGNLWIAHPYKGIYRVPLAEEVLASPIIHYGETEGLSSDLQNHLFRLKDEIVFCSETGVFLFDYARDRFLPFDRFNDIFGLENKVRRLSQMPNGDIWYITENDCGVLKVKDLGVDKTIERYRYPELLGFLNKGYDQIYGYTDDHVFITTDHGFIHYFDPWKDRVDTNFQVVISAVISHGAHDSLIFRGRFYQGEQVKNVPPTEAGLSFLHYQNAFEFQYAATAYSATYAKEYRYRLLGAEKRWSAWTTQTRKEYTNLSPGSYQFEVQARLKGEVMSQAVHYPFTIESPWYATDLAFGIYAILVFGLLSGTSWFLSRKYTDLKEETQKVVTQSEQEIGKLKEANMQAELEHKQRELLSATLHLVQKNETLESIKGQLVDIIKRSKELEVTRKLKALVRLLQQDARLDSGWEQIMSHFNEVHNQYFDRLKKDFPQLTPKDLKLCAYLRMNLSTKEMASLMNVTVRGVEASRYRLRRKLELDKEENLTEFLMKF